MYFHEVSLLIKTGAYVDLHNVVKPAKVNSKTTEMTGSLQSDAIFAAIKDRVAAEPEKAKSINGVFLYKITEGGSVKKQWSKLIFFARIMKFFTVAFSRSKGRVT
jgi:3-hydroxyacyl-CoA dehydrogenase/3a,7a,12a-trihydroxy-5b-cholest-24-enoyl-CoA hydratase